MSPKNKAAHAKGEAQSKRAALFSALREGYPQGGGYALLRDVILTQRL